MSTTFTPLKELEITPFTAFDDEDMDEIEELDLADEEDDDDDGIDEFEFGDGEGGTDKPKKPGFDLDEFGEPRELEF